MAEAAAGRTRISPFLMFQGNAETAMTFYTSLFEDGRIIDIARYGAEDPARKTR